MVENRRKKTRKLALSAVLCALGVTLLYLGALIEVLDLSLAAMASLLVVFAVIELGSYWPLLIYGVTGILAMIVLPAKFGAVVYLLFTGYFPIVKRWAESRMPRLLAFAVKLLVFNLSMLLAYGAMKLFMIPITLNTALYLSVGFLEVTYLLYDFVLTRLITLYVYRFRDKLKIHKILK